MIAGKQESRFSVHVAGGLDLNYSDKCYQIMNTFKPLKTDLYTLIKCFFAVTTVSKQKISLSRLKFTKANMKPLISSNDKKLFRALYLLLFITVLKLF